MVTLTSPGIVIREFDTPPSIGNSSSSIGAFAGVFRWGPCEERVLIDGEAYLAKRFGRPTAFNAEGWLNLASFLAYTDSVVVMRAANTTGSSPIITATANATNATVTTTNTSTLAAGMILVASNNSNFSVGATIASIINSTAFNLDSGSKVLANGAASIQFVSNTSVFSAIGNTASVANLQYQTVKNHTDFLAKEGTFDSNVLYIARCPGGMGNSLRVSVCDSSNGFTSSINLASIANGGAVVTMSVGSNTANVVLTYNHDGTSQNTARQAVNTAAVSFQANLSVTDFIQFGNTSDGTQAIKITAIDTYTSNVNGTVASATFQIHFEDELRLISNVSMSNTMTRFWEFYTAIDKAPGQSDYVRLNGNTSANDELHVVVVDEDGQFTGVAGTPLEIYSRLSRATNAKGLDGSSTNFYKSVINERSQYIWIVNDRVSGYSNTALNLSSVANGTISSIDLAYGQDGSDESAVSLGVLSNAWDFFQNKEEVDISLVLQGKPRGGLVGEAIGNYLIDNLAEPRQDCVVFVSPEKADVVNALGYEADNSIDFRNAMRASSYGFMDSGWKYMYDRYSDIYRYVPLNGDIAGLCARTDVTNDPWWSPAGYNRGMIKNVVKLAWNPRKAFRDALYKKDINPVINDPGHGTLLFGDKTLLGKESALSRINVRRLFIKLEKDIGAMAKYFLFEINDDFTRALFRNTIVPYLNTIKGRRGIYDFQVVCDNTNNPGQVIDAGIMNCDIYIKPARSINYIVLNFVAVQTAASFNSVIGKMGL